MPKLDPRTLLNKDVAQMYLHELVALHYMTLQHPSYEEVVRVLWQEHTIKSSIMEVCHYMKLWNFCTNKRGCVPRAAE